MCVYLGLNTKESDKNIKQYYEKLEELHEMIFREVKEAESKYLDKWVNTNRLYWYSIK